MAARPFRGPTLLLWISLLTGAMRLALAGPPQLASAGAEGCTISGKVVSANGAPLPEVQVVVTELGRSAVTGADGTYALTNIPSGTYEIYFQRVGFAPESRTAQVGGPRLAIDATLRESLIQVQPVQISSTAEPTAILNSPQPMSSLASRDLKKAASPSIGQTVGSMAGVWNLSTGSGLGKPVIRGLGSNRVLVVDGGQRMEGLQGGDDDSPSVETFDAERIEVIRGPASVLYGSDALGGVINIVPKDLPTAFHRKPLLQGEIAGSFGSNDQAGEGSIQVEGAAGGYGFRGGLLDRSSNDIRTPLSRLNNSGLHISSGSAALGARGEQGAAELHYSRRVESIEISPDPGGDPQATPLQRNTEDRARLSFLRPLGPARLEGAVTYERGRRAEYDRRTAPVDSVNNGLLARTYTADLRFHHSPLADMHGLIGLSWAHHELDAYGATPQLPSSRASDEAIYLFEQRETGPWHLSAGARYDHRSLAAPPNSSFASTAAAQSRSFQAVTGNLGALYRVTQPVGIVLNLGSGFRAPGAAELFTWGFDDGSQEFQKGNPELAVEHSFNTDLALRIHTRTWKAEAGGYLNAISNYIYLRPTGTDTLLADVGNMPVYRVTQGNARLSGFEFSSELHPSAELSLEATADFVRGTNISTRQPLPWIPPLRGTAQAHYELGSWMGLESPYLELGGEADARQNRRDPSDRMAPPPSLVAEAGAGAAVSVARRRVSVDLEVKNLFNARYTSFLSRLKAYALAPGRSAVLRVTTEV